MEKNKLNRYVFIFLIFFILYRSIRYTKEEFFDNTPKKEKTLKVEQKKKSILELKEKAFSNENIEVLDVANLEDEITHLEKDELKTLASDRNLNNEMEKLVNKANQTKLSALDFTKLQNLIRFKSVVHKVIIEKEFEELESEQERI